MPTTIEQQAQSRFDKAFLAPPRFNTVQMSDVERNRYTNYFRRNSVLIVRDRMRIENKVQQALNNYIGGELKRLSEMMTWHNAWNTIADDAADLFLALRIKTDSDRSTQLRVKREIRENPTLDDVMESAIDRAVDAIDDREPLFGAFAEMLDQATVLFAESGGRFSHRQIKQTIPNQALLNPELMLRQAGGAGYTLTDAELMGIVFGTPEHALVPVIAARDNRIVSVQLSKAQFNALKANMRQALYENIGGGLGAREIARKLAREYAGQFNGIFTPKQMKNKMELWARTEGVVVQNDALEKIGRDAGSDGHIWQTVGDARVRPAHILNEGDGVIPIKDSFSDGSTNGGSGSVSPYACRCAVGPALLIGKKRTEQLVGTQALRERLVDDAIRTGKPLPPSRRLAELFRLRKPQVRTTTIPTILPTKPIPKIALPLSRAELFQTVPKKNPLFNTDIPDPVRGFIAKEMQVAGVKTQKQADEFLSNFFKGAAEGKSNIAGRVPRPRIMKLTSDQQDAIEAYTTDAYAELNNGLRRSKKLSPRMQKIREDLDSALESLPKFVGTTEREIAFDSRKAFDTFLKGYDFDEVEVIRYREFLSTSKYLDQDFGVGEFRVTMIIEGKNGRNIGSISNVTKEQEVLFPRNSRFELDSINIEGNSATIGLVEI